MFADLLPIVAIVTTIGLPIYLTFRHKQRRMELDAQKLGLAPNADAKLTAELHDENRRLRERVENLETVVLNVDFELNQRLLRVASEQSRMFALRSAAPHEARVGSSGAGGTHAPGDSALFAALAAAPALPMPIAAGMTLAGRYVVEAEVGRGGMGVVYRAHDRELGETVALKVIAPHLASDPQVTERFRREVGASRKVTHPNVVRLFDLGQADGHLFYSMEWFHGRSLEDRLSRNAALPLSEARRIFLAVCDGLEAAHQVGVVHRDLKPGNILVADDGAVKLIDFGLASAAGSVGLTATGLLIGTPAYMAPEQVRGGPQDERTDLYAFGVVLYRALTGVLPFDGKNPIAMGFAHVSETPKPPRALRPELPAEAEALILRAMAKEPRERFPRARDLRAAIEAAL